MPHLRSCLPRAALGEPRRVLTVSGPPTAALQGFATGAPALLAQGQRASEALACRPARELVGWDILLLFKHLSDAVKIF